MRKSIPLPEGGLEKAQKALDLGATPAEVERLGLGWVRVIDGRAVAADSVPVQAQEETVAQAPTPAVVQEPATQEVAPEPPKVEAVPDPAQEVEVPSAELPEPVLPEQAAVVQPEQEEEPEQAQTEPTVFDDPEVRAYWKQLHGEFPNRPIGHKEEKPGALIQYGAALTVLNPTKALFDELASPTFAPDPKFNFYDHYDEIKKTIHPDYWEAMASARSKPELDHKLRKLSEEQHAMQTIFAGNKVVGGLAVVAAILGDPTTALGGVAELAVMTKLASSSRIANALRAGAVMGVTSGAQEAAIASARETVTADDVVTGALIGAGLGMGLGAALRPLRHADLMNDTRRISSEVREERAQAIRPDTGNSAGSGYTATLEDLPPRRFERVTEAAAEDTPAVTRAIREKIQELTATVQRFSTGVENKAGLRVAKKALAVARAEAGRIDQLPGTGRRAAQKKLSAAERAVDDIQQAQAASRSAKTAAAELKAFRAMSRQKQAASIFGDALPTISRGRYTETAESAAERAAALQAREQAAAGQVEEAAPGGGSVGAARADTEESPIDLTLQQRDIIDDAEDWVAANGDTLAARMGTITGRAITKMADLGVSMDSTFFLKAKSAVGKHFGAVFLENGAGLGGREKTAAIIKDVYERRLLSAVMPQYRTSYNAWSHAQGISRFNLKKYYGEGKTRFDRLLREELEQRRLNRSDTALTRDAAIKDAADAWQKGVDEALQILKDAGVRGADDIERIPGYVPLKWQGSALRRIAGRDQQSFLKYKALLGRSYAKSLGIDLEDANLMADAVFQRAMKKELQLDANPGALLTGDARSELRSMFEEAGLNPGRVDALLTRIDNRTGDAGKFKSLRRRNEVDLNEVVGGRSLMDLVDNNMDVLVSRYIAESSGRAALARKGITSDADWGTLKRTLVQDMVAKDDTVNVQELNTRVDAIYSQMLGRPIGEGVNRNVRRMMDLATLSMLGQVGFAQLAEMGTITAQLGMRTMLEEIPSMGRFLRNAREGTTSPDLIEELESLVGRIGDEHLLFRPEVRLEDAAGDDQTWLTVLDKGLAGGQDMLGYASGMNHIKRLQQRMAVKVLASKVAKLAKGESAGRLTPERLADIGWDARTVDQIKKAISKHATFDSKGNLELLHMEDWADPNLVEEFALGLNRFTHQVVQRPQVGETAPWMHSTLGAMFTQFRHFPLVAMEKQLARNTIHADMATFTAVTYGLAWSGMAYVAKQVANAPGQPEGWLEDRLSVDRIGKGAIQYSGMAAMLPDGVSVLAYAGIVPAEWAFNAGRTGGHKQSALSLQAIPSLGAAEDLFNTVTTPTRALWDDYEIGKKDVSALQGATVLGNTLPANILFGLMKQAAE